jgi:hypothetical protein
VTTNLARLTLVGLLITLAACGSPTHDITGTFTLSDSDVDWSASSCSGTGGYSDITEGLGVTVKDGDGKTIATGRLVDDPKGSSASRCHYTFTVAAPESDFYAIAVGRRGELTYSKAELEQQGWEVGFVLGK